MRPRIAMPPSYSATLFLLLLVAAPLQPTAVAKSRRASNPAATASYRRISWASNLTLLGSASFLPGAVAVALTANSSDGIGAGRALFSVPVRFLLPPPFPSAAPPHVSFFTRFTFSIKPSPSYGDGLAFVITSSPNFLGDANGYMGLYRSANASAAGELADVSTVAVELDTHRDVELRDPDDNHIALDAGSIISIASASLGVDLKGGMPVTAWVEYRSTRRQLRSWLSYSASHRPRKADLSVDIDLSPLLRQEMYVGFAASNGDGIAMHIVDVDSWTFRTFDPATPKTLSPAKPKTFSPSASLPSHEASPPPKDEAASLPPPKHHKHHLAVKIIGVILIGIFAMGAVWLVIHRRQKMRRRRKVQTSPAPIRETKSILPLEVERSC